MWAPKHFVKLSKTCYFCVYLLQLLCTESRHSTIWPSSRVREAAPRPRVAAPRPCSTAARLWARTSQHNRRAQLRSAAVRLLDSTIDLTAQTCLQECGRNPWLVAGKRFLKSLWWELNCEIFPKKSTLYNLLQVNIVTNKSSHLSDAGICVCGHSPFPCVAYRAVVLS